jgi:hypothetical protein
MATTPPAPLAFKHQTAAKAAALKACPLGDEAKKFLADDPAPRPFFDALVRQGQFLEALKFLAFALPKREAVWWACACARLAYGPKPPPPAAAALTAAEGWAATGTEEARLAALAAVEPAGGTDTPAGLTAQAAAWGGGSLVPNAKRPVAPGETLTHSAALGALIRAGLHREPERFPDTLRKFLALGQAVADGRHRWTEPKPPAPEE